MDKQSSKLVKFMAVFGGIGVTLLCLYLWWTIKYEGYWHYISQAPADTKQIIVGAVGRIYIQNASDQLDDATGFFAAMREGFLCGQGKNRPQMDTDSHRE